MQTKRTIQCETSVGGPFGDVGENGFACFIETEDGNVLFDLGQGMDICGNDAVPGKNRHQCGKPPSGYIRFTFWSDGKSTRTSVCTTDGNTSNRWVPNSLFGLCGCRTGGLTMNFLPVARHRLAAR